MTLCLLGAVMIFSASAITAQHQYGHSYIFLLRQTVWMVVGLAGMFALMRMDYHRLREPAVVYTTICVVLLMLVGVFFLDKSHATHRWIKFGPGNIQPSELAKLAVILYLAWFLDLKRRTRFRLEFKKEDFLQTLLPSAGPVLGRGALVEMGACRRGRGAAPVVPADHARFLPTGAVDGVSRSGIRSARCGVSIAAIADRGGLGRFHRRWLNGEQTKTFLFAGSAHGFYLCRNL